MKLEETKRNLEKRGYKVMLFSTVDEANAYLNSQIHKKKVGFGGSTTLVNMGLYETLSTHNDVYWHWKGGYAHRLVAMHTDVYLTSANALAVTGEIVNIDGRGNRVSATFFGPQKVYFVIGRNKLCDTQEDAVWRARNIAAPRNAQRLNAGTPCAEKGDRCYDCTSPKRICWGMSILWGPIYGREAEVILIDQELGL